jgi:hypothetical protein
MTRPSLATRLLSSVLLAAALLLPGCGSGVAAGLGTEPAQPTVTVGERLEIAFTSEDLLQGEPEWELQELHGGGLLSTRGRSVTYVAPASAGTFHLTVRGTRADGSPARLVQTVRVMPQARLEPTGAALRPGGTAAFAARIKGLPRGTVTWKVEDADGGAITPEGLYTAPARPGTYRVIATSTEDPAVVLVATVTVN